MTLAWIAQCLHPSSANASKNTLCLANGLDASPFHFGFTAPGFRVVLRRRSPSRSAVSMDIVDIGVVPTHYLFVG
jgi:hypothetical protein